MYKGRLKNLIFKSAIVVIKTDPNRLCVTIPSVKTESESSNKRNDDGEDINGACGEEQDEES